MSSRIKTYQIWIERTAITAGILCVLALGTYGFMLRSIMVNASEHSSLSRSVGDTSSRLAELEFEYITLKQAVTLERAHELGFIEAKSPVFVSVNKKTDVSMRIER